MALTGSVVFKSGEVIGHQKINAAATYTKFELTKTSGNWPSQTFEITSAVVKYTKRTTGSSDITYWKLQSTSSSSGTKIGTSGSYYTFGACPVSEAADSYVGCLVTMVNKADVLPADKVASEKETLNITIIFPQH